MRRVIITGGDGFVGSHLARSFAEQGIEVYALTVPNSPTVARIQNIRGIKVIQGNLMDIQALSLELPQEPMAFIHLAWFRQKTEMEFCVKRETLIFPYKQQNLRQN